MADDGRIRGEIRGTLEGITYWLFERAGARTGKTPAGAMTWLLDRLLAVDEEFLEEKLGVSMERFEAHLKDLEESKRPAAEVVEIKAPRKD